MKETTVKKRSINFTKESLRQMDELCDKFGENPTQVMTRALATLHYCKFNLAPSIRDDKRDDNNEI